jgi:hypothetical protein
VVFVIVALYVLYVLFKFYSQYFGGAFSEAGVE